jgi:two-component system nitrate/nitrite response regulator NarL
VAALEAGAVAYLLKSNSLDALVKALEMVMLGATVLPAATPAPAPLAPSMSSEPSFAPAMREEALQPRQNGGPIPGDGSDELSHRLSGREVATLRCLLAGYSNKLIAREFAITEATVKVHVKAILRKIRVANRTQAAIWAIRHLSKDSPSGSILDHDGGRPA